MTNSRFAIALVLISCFLAGCQTTSEVVKEQRELSDQNQNYLEAQSALDDLTERFKQAKTEDLEYYAAATMKAAKRKLKTANEKFLTMRFDSSRAKRRLVEKIQSSVDDANQLLDTAFRLKAAAETTLGESFAQIKRLEELETAKLFPSDYRDVKKVLDGLVNRVDALLGSQRHLALSPKQHAVELVEHFLKFLDEHLRILTQVVVQREDFLVDVRNLRSR